MHEHFRSTVVGCLICMIGLFLWKVLIYYYQSTCCYGSCLVIIGFTVIQETEVTVPAGTFSVVELSVENIMNCPPYPQSGTYSLNQEIGPIILPGGYELVSFNGVVGIDHTTWGAFKALYR